MGVLSVVTTAVLLNNRFVGVVVLPVAASSLHLSRFSYFKLFYVDIV
jgi:hypothetical protein